MNHKKTHGPGLHVQQSRFILEIYIVEYCKRRRTWMSKPNLGGKALLPCSISALPPKLGCYSIFLLSCGCFCREEQPVYPFPWPINVCSREQSFPYDHKSEKTLLDHNPLNHSGMQPCNFPQQHNRANVNSSRVDEPSLKM